MLRAILSLLVLGIGTVCTKVTHAATALQDLVVHESFNFATERRVLVQLQVRDHEGNPAANRMIEVVLPGVHGHVIERAMTDDYGTFEGSVKLPAHVDTVMVRVNLLGISNQAIVAVDNEMVTHTFE